MNPEKPDTYIVCICEALEDDPSNPPFFVDLKKMPSNKYKKVILRALENDCMGELPMEDSTSYDNKCNVEELDLPFTGTIQETIVLFVT